MEKRRTYVAAQCPTSGTAPHNCRFHPSRTCPTNPIHLADGDRGAGNDAIGVADRFTVVPVVTCAALVAAVAISAARATRITSTIVDNRSMQFSLKVNF